MSGLQQRLLPILAAALFCFGTPTNSIAEYDLKQVKDIGAFQGSEHARELLARNGFVVAEPSFKQIFEPYIRSPETREFTGKSDESTFNGRIDVLPSFITVDSAWHTYHVLLEEAVKQLEKTQSARLKDFSRDLLTKAQEQAKQDTSVAALVRYASIGLALQDAEYRAGLNGEDKKIVEGLRSGNGNVSAPIGFPLSAALFKAQSFYTQSPELSDYFAARQWYGAVVFPLRDLQQTRLALVLASMVHDNEHLFAAWKQLTVPYDTLLAPGEDGSISSYIAAINSPAVQKSRPLSSDAWVAEVQQLLEKQLPLPRVNDQLLSPDQYAQFGDETRGFRLLAPRQLPCAVCFQQTTDPNIPNRQFPSGLDFFVASPILRSAAATRALQSEFGNDIATRVSHTDCGPLPDSMHGEAMRLLANLQKPLPASVPAALRTDAWSDLQLWTQLGAWAEQRHTWALHTKINVNYMGIITPPAGIVAPYPEFFSGLASLSKRTADALASAIDKKFDTRTVAQELSAALNHLEKPHGFRDELPDDLQQLQLFHERYYQAHRAELDGETNYNGYQNRLKDIATHGAQGAQLSESDLQLLRLFFDCRQNAVPILREFVPVCERLAQLATKTLNGTAPNDDDAKWIADYGVTLAQFHFYFGNSYEVPLDNFPIVTRVYSSPVRDSMLYAGLARPQALYVIATNGNSLQLYRGAVLTYREFTKPNSQLLDDESWRDLISKGQTPPAPPFTASFVAELSVKELLQRPHTNSDGEPMDYADIRDLMWQIKSRAKDSDLPELLVAFANTRERADDFAEIIGQMNWDSYADSLLELLKSNDAAIANAAAHILATRPASIPAAKLIAHFGEDPVHARRLYCALFGQMPPNPAVTQALLDALLDSSDGVRWQAAIAIGTAKLTNAECEAALLRTLNDTNEYVGAGAVHALASLHATNAASQLMTKLKQRLAQPTTTWESQPTDVLVITRDIEDEGQHQNLLLDPDRCEWAMRRTITSIMIQRRALRFPPDIQLPEDDNHNFNIADAIIDAFGQWKYKPVEEVLFKLIGTDYDFEAMQALAQINPERLTALLVNKAKDKQIDSYYREQALAKLGDLNLTNSVRQLIPLLDDLTPITYAERVPFKWEWRVCDTTAVGICRMLKWEHMFRHQAPMRPDKRDALLARARKWAKEQQH